MITDDQVGARPSARDSSPSQLVVFTLDEARYALRLSAVERIVRVPEITALPRGPEIVLGVVNIQGDITPVMNIRKRFGLPEREPDLSAHLLLARTSRRVVALVADAVLEVADQQHERDGCDLL